MEWLKRKGPKSENYTGDKNPEFEKFINSEFNSVKTIECQVRAFNDTACNQE
jgi:hypothetical protein